MIIDFIKSDREDNASYPKIDMCKCCECGISLKVSECIPDYGHHDGHEMPPYTEYLCPFCEDGGCVDDFFPSAKSQLDFLRAKNWADESATFSKVYKVKG